jgi:hypothetical protein
MHYGVPPTPKASDVIPGVILILVLSIIGAFLTQL